KTPPAFGSKSQTGHTLGAAGGIESLLAMAGLERRCVPKNVGLETMNCDERLDLATTPRELTRANHALKVASGFGGVQGAAVFSV
ncbi:MAG: 3-oxoacyl-[acyl-carrier-protein] synthase II, partial [Planctomycetota bacterium]